MKDLKSFFILFVLLLSLNNCKSAPPLVDAISNGDIKRANTILDSGGNPNELYISCPAIMWAVHYLQPDLVKLLIERGADINAYQSNVWYNALYMSINNNMNDTIQYLLENGATVYSQHIQLAEKNPELKYDIVKMLKNPQLKNISSKKQKEVLTLAVLDFEPRGISRRDSMRLTDWLRTELINTKQFTVIERNAMNEILKEQSFSLTGCTDTTCAVQVGKLLSARKMLVGIVELYDGQVFINGRIVDVEKGVAEVAHKETVNSIKELDKGAINFAKNIARRANGLPVR